MTASETISTTSGAEGGEEGVVEEETRGRDYPNDADVSDAAEDDEPSATDNDNDVLEKRSTAASASGFAAIEQRAQSVISRVRSRDPRQTARFTHPLSHTKTGSDVIVDFDGPDDPYRPVNWGFTKKAVTTVLYGLTTMGAYIVPYHAIQKIVNVRGTFGLTRVWKFRCHLGELGV